MQNRLSYITLGVDSLEDSLKFYRDGLGLHTEGIIGNEIDNGAVVFFKLQSNLVLALWPRKSMSEECNVPLREPDPSGFMLAHNVGSPEEVDTLMEQAKQAGAKIVRPAAKMNWGGYGGCFQDPDQHLWEIVWNPDYDL